MNTKYFIDGDGNYIGGFQGGDPPIGSIEVPTAPPDAMNKWINGAWIDGLDTLKKKVTGKRYAVEVAGVNFAYRAATVPISTSRETRSSMIGAYTKAVEGRWVTAPDTEKPFKFGDGVFRPATTQEIIDIYRAVETHVDVCYAVEAQKIGEITATGTTDLNTGWPATANIPRWPT